MSRVYIRTRSRMELEKAGELAPNASRSFSHSSNNSLGFNGSFSHFGFNSSKGETETESTSIKNDSDENVKIFRKYTIKTTLYHDNYNCSMSKYDLVRVKKIETFFEGIFREEDLIEIE